MAVPTRRRSPTGTEPGSGTSVNSRSPRAHGVRTFAKGAVISLLAFGFVRIQALADAATYVVPCATIFGVVLVGVGLFQMISGRQHEKGLGIIGILFVALFGFVGAVLGFAVALKHDDKPEPLPYQPTLTDDLVRDFNNELSTSLQPTAATTSSGQ